MADNVTLNTGSGTQKAATDEVTYSGDTTANVQLVRPVLTTGSEGSRTVVDLTGDNTNGLDVDVTRVPTDPFGANADAASATGSISAKLRFIAATGIPVTGTVTVGSHAVTNAGTFATQVDGSALTALQLIDDPVIQDDTGFTLGTGKVMVAGGAVVAHGSNPDAADAADAGAFLMNRHRVQFTIGGHPNIITNSIRLTGSGTDAAVIAGTIGTGTKVVVTRLTVTVSNACTVNVGCKVGFSATTLAADSTTSAAGILVDSDGFPPGGGVNIGDGSGIIGIGGDGEEIRVTNDAPTGGAIHITASYFTIES